MGSRRQFLGFLAMAFAISVAPALAAPRGKKRNKKKPLTKKGHASELPTVKWVRGQRFMVGDKTYELSEFGEVIVDGEEASISDLKPGMQAMVAGSLKEAGETSADSLYKATRVVARRDNDLEAKAKEANRKAAEAARKANQKNSKKK